MDSIEKASIVLIQLEISMDTVSYVLKKLVDLGKRIILNPAPAQKIGDSLYSKIYLITPNETEAFLLSDVEVNSTKSASKAADVFIEKGVNHESRDISWWRGYTPCRGNVRPAQAHGGDRRSADPLAHHDALLPIRLSGVRYRIGLHG